MADRRQTGQTALRNILAPTTFYPLALSIERAEGVYLYDADGRRYMDLIAGIGVSNIGHRHPKIVQAIRDQIDKHLHVMVYGEYLQSTPLLLAQYLTSLLPNSLNCCYLVNSGTEANEGALKLAKRATGRTEIIACHGAYHGSTHGSLSISAEHRRKRIFGPLLPGIRFIEFGKIADLDAITDATACVIMETVQGDAGVRVPPPGYLRAVRKKCDEIGALLILDEIQCGMGRTGTLFAFEQFDVVPDILTLAKAFGGGLPLGAFVAGRELMQWFARDPAPGHITTFGGNPVSCAAALATLRVIQEEKVLERVEESGKRFEQLAAHAMVRGIRRIGMMMALDCGSSGEVIRIVNHALKEGAICFSFLSQPDSLRLAPPLTITPDEVEEGCSMVLKAMDKVHKEGGKS